MEDRFVFNLAMTCLMSGFLIYQTILNTSQEKMKKNSKKRMISLYIYNSMFPIIFFLDLGLNLFDTKGVTVPHRTISVTFSLIIQITIYYLLLAPCITFLRKRFYARTCAMLWLLPTYLYYAFYGFMEQKKPLLIIHGNGKVVWGIILIWFVGFLFILLFKIMLHVWYRTQLLKKAYPVTKVSVLKSWEEEKEAMECKLPSQSLVISPNVFAPLSIGFFQKTTKVILPERTYEEEDLRFIFRHELVHIKRTDCWTKFFLTFLTALCWINPLIWMAMKKSAEDMELSCDETVLAGETKEIRKRYAELILSNAGDQRGFTTCLSGSAQSMRYRLASIVKVTEKKTGAVLSGILLFVLIMSFGNISLSYGEYSGKEALFHNQETDAKSLLELSLIEDDIQTKGKCIAEKELLEYLSFLSLQKITGSYENAHTGKTLELLVMQEHTVYKISISDHMACINKPSGESGNSGWYYMEQEMDWDYISTFVENPDDFFWS